MHQTVHIAFCVQPRRIQPRRLPKRFQLLVVVFDVGAAVVYQRVQDSIGGLGEYRLTRQLDSYTTKFSGLT